MSKAKISNTRIRKQGSTKIRNPRITKKPNSSLSSSSQQDDMNISSENERPLRYFLLKSEPESSIGFENGIDMKFSIEDLKNRPNQQEHWDGVRNYQARNVLKSMRLNDHAFFYHSNCKTPSIVGIVRIVKEYYTDHTQFDQKNPHYDPKSDPANPRWGMVDVEFVRDLERPVTLAELKELTESADSSPSLKSLPLLSRSRFSCQALTPKQWEGILALEMKNQV